MSKNNNVPSGSARRAEVETTIAVELVNLTEWVLKFDLAWKQRIDGSMQLVVTARQ